MEIAVSYLRRSTKIKNGFRLPDVANFAVVDIDDITYHNYNYHHLHGPRGSREYTNLKSIFQIFFFIFEDYGKEEKLSRLIYRISYYNMVYVLSSMSTKDLI